VTNLRTEQEIMQAWNPTDKPLVSVSCITYNHEKYIEDAIEGFLIQETSFPFEILIHDDASTDNTANIVREYAEKYPNLIKPIFQTENQYSKGGGISSKFNFPRAKGEYVALCEGDDYWTDSLKLQKQVDFLEGNPDYSACVHQSKVIYEYSTKQSHVFREGVNDILCLADMLEGRVFHTASVLFRTHIIKKHSLPLNITAGDRALNFLLVSYGSIRFLPDTMCVYRKNEGGISSWVTVDLMKKDLNMIPWICSIHPKFPRNRYKSYIYKTIVMHPHKISSLDIIKYYISCVLFSFSFFPTNIRPIFEFTIIVLLKIIKNEANRYCLYIKYLNL